VINILILVNPVRLTCIREKSTLATSTKDCILVGLLFDFNLKMLFFYAAVQGFRRILW